MKKILLLASIMLATAGLFAQGSSNNSKSETKRKVTEKVCLTPDNGKVVAEYNTMGNLEKKTVYQWSTYSNSWIPTRKYEYSQDILTNQLMLVHSKWDNKKEQWKDSPKTLIYNMKENGMLSLYQTK